MRIGFDAKRAFHNFRGLGNYSRTFIDGLLQFYPENQLFLFTPPFKGKNKFENKNTHLICPTSPIFKMFPSIWRSFFLHKEIEKRDLDIYHGLSHELPFFSDQLKCKKVVTIHDLIFKRFPHFFSSIDRAVYGKKYFEACEKADLIIAICDQTKRDLIDLMGVSPKKIEVAYQSCNPIFAKGLTAIEKEGIRKKYNLPENYLLFVGALEPNKNALNLLRAFKKINKKDLFLVLVGKGKTYKEKLIEEIGELKERVIFYDFIPTEDLPGIYQLAKIFIFPSYFEGFGIPIIEAMFSKTPVITTKGYCFPEAGGPNTLYVDTSNPQEICKAILKVLESQDLPMEMVENGFKYVQRFTLEKTTNKIMEIYRSIQ